MLCKSTDMKSVGKTPQEVLFPLFDFWQGSNSCRKSLKACSYCISTEYNFVFYFV